ncbi:DUF898 family protein [Brevibacillus agri]|uniref:DUF898 family protein n=2 Tax=Brevibacillus agri TaxID=51101 RepID=UPI002E1A31F9
MSCCRSSKSISIPRTREESYFDGGTFESIMVKIGAALLTIATFGFCYPIAVVMLIKWETQHTVIEGRRLQFTGTAAGLFGMWIKIWLLGIITLGIYYLFASKAIKKWKVKHTTFA